MLSSVSKSALIDIQLFCAGPKKQKGRPKATRGRPKAAAAKEKKEPKPAPKVTRGMNIW